MSFNSNVTCDFGTISMVDSKLQQTHLKCILLLLRNGNIVAIFYYEMFLSSFLSQDFPTS